MRSDTERNRRNLIAAAVRLAELPNSSVNMTDVAKEAEVSPATAYRQFGSVEEILAEYRFEVGCRMRDYGRTLDETGLERVELLCRCWVDLVVEHGEAMVSSRSRRGYLDRLRQETYYLTVQAEALEAGLAEAAAELGVPDVGDEALFLWNLLFDPREIFDLIETVGLGAEQGSRQLFAALRGALVGWATERGSIDLGQSWSGVRV
ncbi:TetR/AcrR family transcriptional regulator [Rhodococcus sp. 05-340-1]|nr:TetR/AcrR family transcriptional regulator [Rhodococcus sp. 06-412-2C]OZC96505.1 TetR/AcrR family transcriptional regulator [Rhodococcus sp. 06-412-2B]OZD65450.1 TetR/AcrR family transcriptional regulator [Rhodococcus sp. 05-340-2]OZD74684.1 TetR/AcrR family transcriptional regulator [Rhodococcus sp. 05-340-1]OZD86738.1 TetR/AcrR family transcriptional regulator [Rhodococcus sp. 05-339-2]